MRYLTWTPLSDLKNRPFPAQPAIVAMLGLAASLGIAAAFLSIPLPRQVGLTMRYSLLLTLPLVVFVVAVCFHLPGYLGRFLSLTAVMLFFALPVSGLWASGQSEQYIMGGIFPWSDAQLYYLDSLQLLNGKLMSSFSAGKPLYPAAMAAVLGLGQYHLPLALGFWTLLAGAATHLAGREVQRSHGSLAGACLVGLLFCFYRRFSGTTMTENLGFPLGLLAFAALWRAAYSHRFAWAVGGVFLLTLALNARQGAYFALPLIAAWAGWLCRGGRRFSWKILLACLGAILAGFLINSIIQRTIVEPGAGANYQLVYHLYGLVTGGQDWTTITYDQPELFSLPQEEFIQQGLLLIWNLFKKHPGLLVKGILKHLGDYFCSPDRGGFSYLDSLSLQATGVLRAILFGLAGAGLARGFRRNTAQPGMLLLAVTAIGMLASIPIVPPGSTFRMRLYAATIWAEVLLPVLGATWLLDGIPSAWRQGWNNRMPTPARVPEWVLATACIFLAVFSTTSPLLAKALAKPALPPQTTCPNEQESVVLRKAPGSYLVLVGNDDPREGWIPFIRLNFFKNKVHNLANFEIFPEFDRLEEPTALLFHLNLLGGGPALVFADPGMLPEQDGLVEVCGNHTPEPTWLSTYFFYARSIISLP